MFEGLAEIILETWARILALVGELYEVLATSARAARDMITGLEPTQRAVLWIQLAVGLMTIVWIIFQFAWLRRLNEARLERHLESTISSERDELADERTTTLAELDRVVKRRGLRRLILFAWAHIRLTISLVLRLLSLGTTRRLADHGLLLMRVGAEHRARAIFTQVAREASKKIKLYKDAIDNKTLEAQNALIFTGRVAVVERRTAAAVLLFRAANSIREDADVRLLIGKQMAAVGALDGAMIEFEAVLNFPAGAKPSTKSEAYRCIAEVHLKRGPRGRALPFLRVAQRIDREHQNYAGLARTHELVGDLYEPRRDRQGAALAGYARSAENYDLANMPAQARAVSEKFDRLSRGGIPDGWWTRRLEQYARWILRQVERRRVQARMKAA